MPKLYEDDYRNTVRDDITDALLGRPYNWQSSLSEVGKPFAANAAVPKNQTSQFAAPPAPQFSVEGIGGSPQLGGTLPPMQMGKGQLTMGGSLQPLQGKKPLGGLNMQYMRRF